MEMDSGDQGLSSLFTDSASGVIWVKQEPEEEFLTESCVSDQLKKEEEASDSSTDAKNAEFFSDDLSVEEIARHLTVPLPKVEKRLKDEANLEDIFPGGGSVGDSPPSTPRAISPFEYLSSNQVEQLIISVKPALQNRGRSQKRPCLEMKENSTASESEGSSSSEEPSSSLGLEENNRKKKISEEKGTLLMSNEKHACLYCQKLYQKNSIFQHLRNHKEKAEVIEISKLAQRERGRKLKELVRMGDYEHNMRVMERKRGEVIFAEKPPSGDNGYGPCTVCLGFFGKSLLKQHLQTCTYQIEPFHGNRNKLIKNKNRKETSEVKPNKNNSKMKPSISQKGGQPPHACFYCGLYTRKLEEHFMGSHKNDKDLSDYLKLTPPKRDKELKRLARIGDYKHNLKVVWEKSGSLLVENLSGKRSMSSDYKVFGSCSLCLRFIPKSLMKEHMKMCTNNKSDHLVFKHLKGKSDLKEKKASSSSNQYHACCYCGELSKEIYYHYSTAHRQKSKVADIMNSPFQLQMIKLKRLVRKGDYLHNLKVMRKKEGQVIYAKPPTGKGESNTGRPCRLCLGFFPNSFYSAHLAKCKLDTKMLNKWEKEPKGKGSRAEATTTSSRINGKRIQSIKGAPFDLRHPSFKNNWTLPEKKAVLNFFKSYIKDRKVPGKGKCLSCIKENGDLSFKTWPEIKLYVQAVINRRIKRIEGNKTKENRNEKHMEEKVSVITNDLFKHLKIDDRFTKSVLENLTGDEYLEYGKSDPLIVKVAYNKYLAKDLSARDEIADEMAMLGKLIVALRKRSGRESASLCSFICCDEFPLVVRTVKEICLEEELSEAPSFDVDSLRDSLKSCAKAILMHALISSDDQAETLAQDFIKAIDTGWLKALAEISDKDEEAVPAPTIRKRRRLQHFCKFCRRIYKRFREHLLYKHLEEPEVKTGLGGSPKEIRLFIQKLQMEGDEIYNSLNPNNKLYNGQRRYKLPFACPNCKGSYAPRSFNSHVRNCDPSLTNKEINMLKRKAILLKEHNIPSSLSERALEVFILKPRSKITRDLIFDNPILVEYVNKLSESGLSAGDKANKRKQLTMTCEILHEMKQVCAKCDEQWTGCSHLFIKKKFYIFEEAIKKICCYDKRTGFGNINLVLQYSRVIRRFVSFHNEHSDEDVAREAESWLFLLSKFIRSICSVSLEKNKNHTNSHTFNNQDTSGDEISLKISSVASLEFSTSSKWPVERVQTDTSDEFTDCQQRQTTNIETFHKSDFDESLSGCGRGEEAACTTSDPSTAYSLPTLPVEQSITTPLESISTSLIGLSESGAPEFPVEPSTHNSSLPSPTDIKQESGTKFSTPIFSAANNPSEPVVSLSSIPTNSENLNTLFTDETEISEMCCIKPSSVADEISASAALETTSPDSLKQDPLSIPESLTLTCPEAQVPSTFLSADSNLPSPNKLSSLTGKDPSSTNLIKLKSFNNCLVENEQVSSTSFLPTPTYQMSSDGNEVSDEGCFTKGKMKKDRSLTLRKRQYAERTYKSHFRLPLPVKESLKEEFAAEISQRLVPSLARSEEGLNRLLQIHPCLKSSSPMKIRLSISNLLRRQSGKTNVSESSPAKPRVLDQSNTSDVEPAWDNSSCSSFLEVKTDCEKTCHTPSKEISTTMSKCDEVSSSCGQEDSADDSCESSDDDDKYESCRRRRRREREGERVRQRQFTTRNSKVRFRWPSPVKTSLREEFAEEITERTVPSMRRAEKGLNRLVQLHPCLEAITPIKVRLAVSNIIQKLRKS